MKTIFETMFMLFEPPKVNTITLKLIASDFLGKFYDDTINGVLPTAARRTWPKEYILTNGIDISIGDDHYQHEYYSHVMHHEDALAASLSGYDDTIIRTIVLTKTL